jgi:glycine/D-amino acid oxidase-like deaminating enzyme
MTSQWLLDLGDDIGPPTELQHDVTTDVAIVGGGFVGLWTAIHVKLLDSTCRVTVLEMGRCGHGASGLNGGFVMSWWPKIASLSRICGDEDAVWLAQQTTGSVASFGDFLDEHSIDAELVRGGWLWTATTPAHIGAWDGVVTTARRLGHGDVFEALTPEEVARRTGSKAHLAGILEPMNATVHPAKLGQGLAAVARKLGVAVYERTRVERIERSRPAKLTGRWGSVTADKVVIATNAWAASVPELASSFICVTSAVVATQPIPDRIAAIGWTGGESITDSQTTVDYYRTTRSGRIIFGKGSGRPIYVGAPGESAFADHGGIKMALADFRRVYPALADVPIAQSWSGPIDRTYDGLPLLGRLPAAPHVAYGVGWSGNGVNPSRIGGRILAGLALDRRDRWTLNALVDRSARHFPPEPIRFIGASVVRGAVIRKDAADIAGRKPSLVDRSLARLAPSGLEDKE